MTKDYKIETQFTTIPTCQCLVCECVKDENASIINTAIAWLCPECKRRIRKIIYNEEKEETR